MSYRTPLCHVARSREWRERSRRGMDGQAADRM